MATSPQPRQPRNMVDVITRGEFDATINGLKEFISIQFSDYEKLNNTQFAHVEKTIELRGDASEGAVKTAMESMNVRLANTNEWRNALDKYITTLSPKEMVEKLEIAVSALQLSKATLEGKASMSSVLYAQVTAAVGILIGLAGILLRYVK